MKPIKHMRSKRGFYIGRVPQTTHTPSTNNRTKEWTGRMGKSMIFSSLLVTLDSYKKAHKS
ncbi:hypothetical protein OCF65_22580 [Bacillus toyonensis]|uniref:hypothetical protein n=1 Tax=Bacillus toyonensis TaxID=155322 RepID=UPI0021D0EF11|nr:hypothetical protein [Bacillus toyonensis]MCU5583213.1 hypothetical protein [Bacillus toyonensis]